MKNALMASAAIALLITSGSIAYYFVLVLPQQQITITERHQRNKERGGTGGPGTSITGSGVSKNCSPGANAAHRLRELLQNAIDYINQQCPNSNSVTLNNWDCSRKVQQSAYYQQHFTCKAPW